MKQLFRPFVSKSLIDSGVNIFIRNIVVSAIVTTTFLAGVGFFVYFKNRKGSINKVWLLFTLNAMLWSFGVAQAISSTSQELALFWYRFLNLSALFLPPSFLFFILTFLGVHKEERKRMLFSLSLAGSIFILAILFPQFYIKEVAPKFGFNYIAKPEILYYLYFLFFGVYITYSIYRLFKYFRKAKMAKRNQIKYLFISMAIGFSGGITVFLPVFNINFVFGGYIISFAIFVMAYAIIRHRLLEIDTVIHRTALWFLTLLLVILPVGLLVTISFDWIASLSRLGKLAFVSATLIFFVRYYSKFKPRVDHFFRRRKYDYYQVLGEIGQKIGSELDINNVTKRLFKELQEVLYIRNGIVLVQQPEQLDYSEVGSTGYDAMLESQKLEKVTLACQNSLSRWLNEHQKVLEREQIELDPQYEPIKQEALQFLNTNSIEIFIPVVMENKVNALLGIGKKENLQAYTIKDIELLENMGRQIGITIDDALHHEDIVEKERLAEEMKLGREIQMNLLPRVIPQIPGLTVQGFMQTAKEIGGDYYDFITLPNKDELAIVIGDVSGKGVAAGLLMAMAKTAISALSQEQASPRLILLKTNSILFQHIGGQKFMTLLYLRYNSKEHTLTYSSAGHEHILVYRASTQELEAILSGGFMLGMLPEIEGFLEEKELRLNAGDKVVLYTDGVTEARNEKGELYSLGGLTETVLRYRDRSAPELIRLIKDEVFQFIGTQPQYDDITLVVMERG